MHARKVTATVLVVIGFNLLALPAFAHPDEEAAAGVLSLQQGVHEHDGFFLRMALGFGYHAVAGTGTGAGVRDPESEATGQDLSLSIGGAVVENVIIHVDAQLFGSMFDVEHRNLYGAALLGLGATYYLMPVNVYFSGSVGYCRSVMYVPNEDGSEPTRRNFEDTAGIAISGSVGKEWWTGDNWGMGLALKGAYTHTTDENLTFHTGSLMVLLSATYN